MSGRTLHIVTPNPQCAPVANMTSDRISGVGTQQTTQTENSFRKTKACKGSTPRYCKHGTIHPEYHFFSDKKSNHNFVVRCIRCRLVLAGCKRRPSDISSDAIETSLLQQLKSWRSAVIGYYSHERDFSTQSIQDSLTDDCLASWVSDILSIIESYKSRNKGLTLSETVSEFSTADSPGQGREVEASDTAAVEDPRDPDYRPDTTTTLVAVGSQTANARPLKRKANEIQRSASLRTNNRPNREALSNMLVGFGAHQSPGRLPSTSHTLSTITLDPSPITGARERYQTRGAILTRSESEMQQPDIQSNADDTTIELGQTNQDNQSMVVPPRQISGNQYAPLVLGNRLEEELLRWLNSEKQERERLKDKDISPKLPRLIRKYQTLAKEFLDDLKFLFFEDEDFDRRWV